MYKLRISREEKFEICSYMNLNFPSLERSKNFTIISVISYIPCFEQIFEIYIGTIIHYSIYQYWKNDIGIRFQMMNNCAIVSALLSKWSLKMIHVGFTFLKPGFLRKKMKFILIFYLQSISTLSKAKLKPLMLDLRPWWIKSHLIVFMVLTIW